MIVSHKQICYVDGMKIARNTVRTLIFMILAVMFGFGIGLAVGSGQVQETRIVRPIEV